MFGAEVTWTCPGSRNAPPLDVPARNLACWISCKSSGPHSSLTRPSTFLRPLKNHAVLLALPHMCRLEGTTIPLLPLRAEAVSAPAPAPNLDAASRMHPKWTRARNLFVFTLNDTFPPCCPSSESRILAQPAPDAVPGEARSAAARPNTLSHPTARLMQREPSKLLQSWILSFFIISAQHAVRTAGSRSSGEFFDGQVTKKPSSNIRLDSDGLDTHPL